jgi:hypothetical protein
LVSGTPILVIDFVSRFYHRARREPVIQAKRPALLIAAIAIVVELEGTEALPAIGIQACAALVGELPALSQHALAFNI